MPLLLIRHPFPDVTFGLWQIAENETYFTNRLPLTDEEFADFNRLKGLRRLEWLASRWLLHLLTGAFERLPMAKNAFSKPFFLKNPEWHCSLSHSQGVVGAMIARQNCGCDLQLKVEKMARLAVKFLHPNEAAFIDQFPPEHQLDLQHVFWTAKESLYKAYGLNAVDFKQELRVDAFEFPVPLGSAKGYILKNSLQQNFTLYFESFHLYPIEQNGFPSIDLPDRTFWWTICL